MGTATPPKTIVPFQSERGIADALPGCHARVRTPRSNGAGISM
jgi:hypothetical protein